MGLLRVIRETFLDFGRNTSIAGLNNAMKAKSIIRSLIWLTLFSVGLYFTLVGIISVVKDYNQYPVVTKTELQQEKLINFPAISICNHNRVHCNNLLTQYYTLKEVLENGTTTSGLNQTILILSELFDKTGCRAQVCDQIIDPLAVNRSATVNYSSTDWNLVRLAQIDCDLESEKRELICYHLAFAYEEKTNNSKYAGPVVKRVTKAQNSFGCGQVNVCNYGGAQVTNEMVAAIASTKPGGGKPTIAYRYPEACSSDASNNDNEPNQQNGQTPDEQGPNETQTGDTTNETSNGTQGGGTSNVSVNGTDEGTTDGNSSGPQGTGDTTNGTSNGTQGGGTSNASVNGTDAGTTTENSSGPQGAGNTNAAINGTDEGNTNAAINGTDEGNTTGSSSGPQEQSNGNGNGGLGSKGGARKKRSFVGPPSAATPTKNEFDELAGDIGIYAEFLIDYLKVPKEVRLSIGHQLSSTVSSFGTSTPGFIQECTYRGKSCSDPKFWYAQDTPGYGNCYSFNAAFADIDDEAPRKASLTGITNGFSIQLFLDQENYMLQKLSKKAGARLVIHDTRSPPLPDEYGIDLQPNTASSIAIQKNDVERKAAPYDSNCSDSWARTGYNIDTNMTYTLAACQRYCLQKDLIDSCECFHPDLYQAAIPLHENVRTCNVLPVSNNTDYTCFERVFDEYNKLKRNCSCSVACQETEFASTVSVSKWPSNQYFVEFGLNLKGVEYAQDDLKGKGDNSGEVQSELQQNYVQADIYYQTLNVRSIVQEAKYSEEGYAAALGGALSVYLGIAVIMIFELLELVIDLVINVWKFYNGGKEEKH